MIKLNHVLLVFAVGLNLVAFNVASAAPMSLNKKNENKVLFMLFENQNRKTITSEPLTNCKSNDGTKPWACDHKTVKSVLMEALFVGVPADSFSKHSQMQCDAITKEMKSSILDRVAFNFGPVAFRREIINALNGQWVCTFTAHLTPRPLLLSTEKTDIEPSENSNSHIATEAAAKGPPVVAGDTLTSFGLTFLVNRDMSRIVSRNIVSWSQP